MAEIKCPKCGEVFTVDESNYEKILNQVKNEEFEKELSRRLEDVRKQNSLSLEIEKNKAKNESEKEISALKTEIERLKGVVNNQRLEASNTLLNEKQKIQSENDKEVSKLKEEINRLNNELKLSETNNKLVIQQALNKKEQEIQNLNNKISLDEKEFAIEKQNLQKEHENIIKAKDEQIAFYKDFKARSNVKLLGESLEQHCLNEFNKIRMTAYPNATFEKDNEVVEGTKGDFIFREMLDDKMELLSIMFDMKNEGDETATKHKNEDFLDKLDKDRRKKNCEYAVLVSMLEPESDYYNSGIVDVSYRYPKMYVVRPQFFLTIISLLYNAAKTSLEYRNELQLIKNQNLDITRFEDQLIDFQDKFGNNYRLANEKFSKAIDEIDKTIDHLTKVKEGLLGADRQLRIANDKAQDLSVKKLTRNNPTMIKMFEDLKKEKE